MHSGLQYKPLKQVLEDILKLIRLIEIWCESASNSVVCHQELSVGKKTRTFDAPNHFVTFVNRTIDLCTPVFSFNSVIALVL